METFNVNTILDFPTNIMTGKAISYLENLDSAFEAL